MIGRPLQTMSEQQALPTKCEDFPDDDLSIKNFNYVKKPMGMNNAAYEVVRQAKLQDACKLFLVFFRIN